MPVTAGETVTETQPAQAVVSASELAKEIVGAVAQLNRQQPAPMTQQEEKDMLDEVFQKQVAEGRVDKDVAPILRELVTAGLKDVEKRAQKEAAVRDRQSTQNNVQGELSRMIERYAQTAPNPELIRELRPSIMQKVIDEYNANPRLVARFDATREVDWTEMDKMVVKHVSKWSATKEGAAETEKKAGGPAMKNDAPSGAVETTGTVDPESFSEKQKEMFNSQVSFGVKYMGKSRADAEKRATELINQAETKVKSAKR